MRAWNHDPRDHARVLCAGAESNGRGSAGGVAIGINPRRRNRCVYSLKIFDTQCGRCERIPGSAATSVLTLALGIGATTAIFSVVYGVLLRPLPYNDPSRIMAIFEVQPNGKWNRLADPNFDDFRDQSRSFETIAKYGAYPTAVSGGSQPTSSIVGHVSSEFFNVFRVEPMRGRGLTA